MRAAEGGRNVRFSEYFQTESTTLMTWRWEMTEQRGVKDDFRVFGLGNWKNRAAIYWDEKAYRGST